MRRALAMAILLISIAMLAPIGAAAVATAAAPIGAAAVAMFDGRTVVQAVWSVPLAILATGWVLTWLLSRKQIPLQLYILAFALWILTAGYFFVRFVRLP